MKSKIQDPITSLLPELHQIVLQFWFRVASKADKPCVVKLANDIEERDDGQLMFNILISK
jgi:hypothetical protein